MATGRWSAHLLIKQEVLQALQDSGGSIGAGGGGEWSQLRANLQPRELPPVSSLTCNGMIFLSRSWDSVARTTLDCFLLNEVLGGTKHSSEIMK